VIRTRAVTHRTTLLLLRMRFLLELRHPGREPRQLLAEDAQVLAFTGQSDEPTWLAAADPEALLGAAPAANIHPEQAVGQLERAVGTIGQLAGDLERFTRERADVLLRAHQRVREGARAGGSATVEPQLPPDVLGTYVLLPAGPD